MGAVQVGVNENKGLYNMMVYLNKTNFYPGETIIGEIKLFLKNDFPNVPQNLKFLKISFSLIHREYWQNHDNVSLSTTKTTTNSTIKTDFPLSDEGKLEDDIKHTKEEVIFSKIDVINLPNNNNIQNGLSLPFQITIPKNAKPSLEFLNTIKIYAYSRTFLNIEILDTENEAKLMIFIQKIPTPLKSDLTIIKSVVKKKLGIFGSGNNINFQGSYPKNTYGFNEICPINIKLDTYGAKETIKSISVILKRKINFLQNGIKSLFKFNEYINDLWQNTMSSFESSQDFNFNIPLNETSKIFMQKKSLFVDVNSISKDSLICLLPSYEGQFIKCEYFIQIKVNFDSLLIKDPEFIMPLDIGHTPSFFVQNSMFDINKILNNHNRSMSLSIMVPDIFINNNFNKNNNINNINNENKIKKVFGEKGQDIINNNKAQNKKNNMSNINNINNMNNINDYKETPEEGVNYPQNNNYQPNPYQNIKLEDSYNLPSLDELNKANNAKNEQAAPGLTPDI